MPIAEIKQYGTPEAPEGHRQPTSNDHFQGKGSQTLEELQPASDRRAPTGDDEIPEYASDWRTHVNESTARRAFISTWLAAKPFSMGPTQGTEGDPEIRRGMGGASCSDAKRKFVNRWLRSTDTVEEAGAADASSSRRFIGRGLGPLEGREGTAKTMPKKRPHPKVVAAKGKAQAKPPTPTMPTITEAEITALHSRVDTLKSKFMELKVQVQSLRTSVGAEDLATQNSPQTRSASSGSASAVGRPQQLEPRSL